MTAAIALPRLFLSDDEDGILSSLLSRLAQYQTANDLVAAYYEGRQRVRDLGIAIPPNLRLLEATAGWPGTVVDVLEERLDWFGWGAAGNDFGLSDVYADNDLGTDGGLVHLDSLIFGTSFATVGNGFDGEPDVLVTASSPTQTTGLWDPRARRLSAAVTVTSRGDLVPGQTLADQVDAVTLYLPDETIQVTFGSDRRRIVESRDRHNLARVPVVQFRNRPRGSRLTGRSEITSTVRYYTDAAVRTMLGMEVSREFYSAPQRYALGVTEKDFIGADGKPRTGWETILGRVWALGRDENDELPEVGQFTASSPAPYIDQVKALAQLLAAEAAIPPSYLGFTTENPASADAIQRSEARLVKRAERRQTAFGAAWLEVGRLALLARGGSIPDAFASTISAKWRDAATPTRSAAADEATKLVGVGVLPADSKITLDRIGLTPAEQAQLAADRARQAPSGAALLANVIARQATGGQ